MFAILITLSLLSMAQAHSGPESHGNHNKDNNYSEKKKTEEKSEKSLIS